MQRQNPFSVEAICLLPDHLHCIWCLPVGDSDFSKRWNSSDIYQTIFKAGRWEGDRNASRNRKGEAAVWQRRFWEHLIRDEKDFTTHFDYIHFNPVRHGYVSSPRDWKWSSFHRYLRLGYIKKNGELMQLYWRLEPISANKHTPGRWVLKMHSLNCQPEGSFAM